MKFSQLKLWLVLLVLAVAWPAAAQRVINRVQDIPDTRIGTKNDGDVLTWDATAGKWTNAPGAVVTATNAIAHTDGFGTNTSLLNPVLQGTVVLGDSGSAQLKYLSTSPLGQLVFTNYSATKNEGVDGIFINNTGGTVGTNVLGPFRYQLGLAGSTDGGIWLGGMDPDGSHATEMKFTSLTNEAGILRGLTHVYWNTKTAAGGNGWTITVSDSNTVATAETGANAGVANQWYLRGARGGGLQHVAATPYFNIIESDQATDGKTWQWLYQDTDVYLQAYNGAGTSAHTPLLFTRAASSTNVTAITLRADAFAFEGGTVTAPTFAGAGGGLTLDASSFDGNLATTDNTLQEVAQKLDDLVTGGGSGDVTAASSFGTDNRLIRSDGTGKGVQASVVTLSDTGAMSGVESLTVTNSITAGTGTTGGLDIGGLNIVTNAAGTVTLKEVDAIDATTEATLEAALDIAGDVAGTGLGAVTIQANAVALTTDTTGNYVATVADAGSSRITVTGSGSEGAAVTLDLADNAVSNAKLADDAVDSAEIADGAVDKVHLSANAQGIYTETHGTSHTLSIDATTGEGYGSVHYVTAGSVTITLPAVVAGASFTIISHTANAVILDVNGSDLTWLDGVTTADGDSMTSPGAAGDMIVVTYFGATGWAAQSNGWTDTN